MCDTQTTWGGFMRTPAIRLYGFCLASILCLSTGGAFAQKGNTPTGGGAAGTGTTPGAGTPGTANGTISNPNGRNNNPINNPTLNNDGPFANRPIFLSGRVMFDDGSPVNNEIRIERVCSGNARLEAHVDSKGRFSFQLGGNTALDTDASNSSMGGFGQGGRSSNNSGTSTGGFGSSRQDSMWNCELRAAYPGYRSDVVELGTRHSLDDPEVGTIVLHRLANVKGSTISLTTAAAPKPALKNYEKGIQLAQKGKFEEAQKHLLAATELYPKFAAAWFALGQTQQRENQTAEAQKSYEAAIEADHKFVSPYDQLALMAAQQGKWAEAAKYSKSAIDLNPVEFPSAFWYNAISNYNLKNSDDALKSAQALVKIDSRHRYPEAESMLAQLAVEKGDYPEAATHLRSYLQLAPNAKNAEALKTQLLKIEEASAAKK
jgi:tetratricopeptide (TPR) repeat protein